MSSLHEFLKQETAVLHAQLEARPYFQALRDGILPKPAVVTYLRCLSVIHSVLEASQVRVWGRQGAATGGPAHSKLSLLVADLGGLDATTLPSITPAIQTALRYGRDLLASADVDPLSLVGVLYVLEGSQNGGVLLKRAYADCLGVAEEQLSYIGCYGSKTAAQWAAFVNSLNALTLNEQQRSVAALAAVRCFEALDQICASLYPYQAENLHHHIASINFEAGDHVMPQDPVEIDVALRAGKAAWEAYPYLNRRFGERGERFTTSDSCWLVALTRMPVETATKNLRWLRPILAIRGIPTIIMETHLRAITAGLAEVFPGQTDLPARFEPFLASIDAERRAVADPDRISRLIEEFDRRFRSSPGQKIASTAELITSAWFDERCCRAGCLPAMRNWLSDPSRFSRPWITTVNDLVLGLDDAAKPVP